MKTLFAALMMTTLPGAAIAQDARPPKQLPAPVRAQKRNPCAEFGAGFVQAEGTSTCVKIGGSVSIGGGYDTMPAR